MLTPSVLSGINRLFSAMSRTLLLIPGIPRGPLSHADSLSAFFHEQNCNCILKITATSCIAAFPVLPRLAVRTPSPPAQFMPHNKKSLSPNDLRPPLRSSILTSAAPLYPAHTALRCANPRIARLLLTGALFRLTIQSNIRPRRSIVIA